MATDIVQSLFGVTPDMYQQQQARQADARALQFARLTPMEQAQYGIGRGAYGLAGAIGGALGAQDPELQMISQRNAIAKQIDPTDPESMRQGIQALVRSGDTVGGLQLTEVLRKLESEMAQSFQRRAAGTASLAQAARERVAATPEKIQLARELASQRGAPGSPEYNLAYDAELTRLTTAPDSMTPDMRNAAALAAQAGPVGSPEYNAAYQAQLTRLTAKPGTNEPTTNELTNARALALQKGVPGSPEYNAELQSQLTRLTAKPPTNEPTTNEVTNARALALRVGPVGSPEYNAEFQSQLARLTIKPSTNEPTTNELTNARAVALRAGPVGSPEYNAALDAEYKRLTAKTDSDVVVVGNALVSKSTGKPIYEGSKPEKYSAFAQELIDAGLTPGTAPFEKRMLEYVAGKTKGAERGVGNVSIGGITIDTGAAAKAAGTIVGQGVANIENQYSMLTAFNDAVSLVDQGIYGGAYGPEQAAATKYSLGLLGNKKKLENTEVFLANIGEIVIPRLQQFGGNDSNEELKYLQKVVAGDQRLEPAAVKRILMSAEKKVRNNIARLQKQAGGELPTGPVTPAAAASAPTKRYNPQTRKIEPISGN